MSDKPLMTDVAARDRQRANVRLALILASLAATFFFGFIVKMVMLKTH